MQSKKQKPRETAAALITAGREMAGWVHTGKRILTAPLAVLGRLLTMLMCYPPLTVFKP